MRICATFAACAICGDASALDQGRPERYAPVFDVDLAASGKGIVAAYLLAYRSPTREIAIVRWKKIIEEFGGDMAVDDLTDLMLLRQAYLELMRLHYQDGRTAEADTLLKKANDYLVYSTPEASKAQAWCKKNDYCR